MAARRCVFSCFVVWCLNQFPACGAKQRGGAVVARQAHNLKVAGAIPAPATTKRKLHSNFPRGKPHGEPRSKKSLLWGLFAFREPRGERSELFGASPERYTFFGTAFSCILMSMYYVYLLENQDDKSWYVGYSMNLRQRIDDHKNGSGGRTTRVKKNWRLIYYEAYVVREDVLGREKFLKGGSGRSFLKKQLVHYLRP